MGYIDDYQRAKEKGKTEQVTTIIYKFEEEGDVLVGKVLDIRPFTEGKFDTEVHCYILETDMGRVSTVLGSATDKQLDKAKVKGKIIAITYHGQKDIAGGQSVNLYTVEVL